MKICDIVAEPMKIQKRVPPRGSLRAEAEFQMHFAGLDAGYLDKYPAELSGGQRAESGHCAGTFHGAGVCCGR